MPGGLAKSLYQIKQVELDRWKLVNIGSLVSKMERNFGREREEIVSFW